MSDHDQSSKTEAPSAKKLKEAFERGQFPRSQEIETLAVLVAAFAVLTFTGPESFERLSDFSRMIFGGLATLEITQVSVTEAFATSGFALLGGLAPLLAATSGAAILAGGLQSGFRFTPKVTELNWNRLNPVEGAKKLCNTNSLIRSSIDILKLLSVGAVVLGICRARLEDPIFQAPSNLSHLTWFLSDTASQMLRQLILIMAGIATLHYLWQFFDTMRQLRMTKQEVKDEFKQSEGDPHIKLRLRQMGLRLMQKQMLQEIPFADVVVTNPTHYAVALRYESGRDSAPVVLAKGKNRFAQRIKAEAAAHDVPLMENRPAAQALYKLGQVGKPIPTVLFRVVASILSHVYREHRYYFHRLRARRQARPATAGLQPSAS